VFEPHAGVVIQKYWNSLGVLIGCSKSLKFRTFEVTWIAADAGDEILKHLYWRGTTKKRNV